MLELKYKSPPFIKMTDNQIKGASIRLLFKINIITGWQLLSDPLDQEILNEQFQLKLKEAYPYVNCDEIEYAFRNNTGIKDWGKSLNLGLIDEVLQPYLKQRTEVSKMEESKKLPPPMKFGNVLTTQEEKLQDIADWETRKEYSINHVPPFLYDYLLEFEKINPTTADKWEAMRKATEILKTELYNESLNLRTDDINRYQAYLKMFGSGEYTGDVTNRLKLLAKKVMIIDYLNSTK